MRRGNHPAAIGHFRKVLQLKATQIAVWLYLGQSYYDTEQYSRSVDALRRGRAAGERLPSFYRLLAKAELAAGLTDAGYQTLLDGAARFPDRPELQLDRALFLIEAGLYSAALEAAEAYLATRAADAHGHAVMAEALRSSGRPLEAAAVLENALIEDPSNPDLIARLGLSYSSAQKHLASARAFFRAGFFSGQYQFETAEQFRLAGKTRRALLHNEAVPDQVKRLRQRLTILLAGERYDRAAALFDQIEQANAWNDNTRYLLAYAHLQTGELERSEQLCRQITEPALKASAEKVLETIASLRSASPPS
jgi:predicted Zn-dependent protease